MMQFSLSYIGQGNTVRKKEKPALVTTLVSQFG